MSLVDDRGVASVNPDCREGKHRACRGDAWSVSADRPMDCACSCHRRVRAVCPVASCREDLGEFGAEDGFSAEWWADKAVVEHVGEYHD